MKASLKLRDDQKPLLRAKVPVSVLGLPFLSGVTTGDARELRLDLATAFESGPCLRVSYRPNDRWNPFSLAVKIGAGALGSPVCPFMAMTAEFSLAGRGGPKFTLQLKPRFGDFCVRKTTSSAAGAPPPFALGGPVVVDHGADGDGLVVFAGKKPNGISEGVPAAAAAGGGIGGLLSGTEITARSSLPLGSRAAVRFRWGVSIPPELRSGFMEDPVRGVSLGKLPLLVMTKISIEHLAGEPARSEKKHAGASEASFAVQRQLVELQAEQGALRKVLEELRAGLGAGGPRLVGSGGDSSGTGWECNRTHGKAGTFQKNAGDSIGRKGDGKANRAGGTASKEDVGDELRKALMGAAGAGS